MMECPTSHTVLCAYSVRTVYSSSPVIATICRIPRSPEIALDNSLRSRVVSRNLQFGLPSL